MEDSKVTHTDVDVVKEVSDIAGVSQALLQTTMDTWLAARQYDDAIETYQQLADDDIAGRRALEREVREDASRYFYSQENISRIDTAAVGAILSRDTNGIYWALDLAETKHGTASPIDHYERYVDKLLSRASEWRLSGHFINELKAECTFLISANGQPVNQDLRNDHLKLQCSTIQAAHREYSRTPWTEAETEFCKLHLRNYNLRRWRERLGPSRMPDPTSQITPAEYAEAMIRADPRYRNYMKVTELASEVYAWLDDVPYGNDLGQQSRTADTSSG